MFQWQDFSKASLNKKESPCHLRGYYHRALLYFFGPYIEISVLVPEDRVADTREVIENYFDPKVLTARPPGSLETLKPQRIRPH